MPDDSCQLWLLAEFRLACLNPVDLSFVALQSNHHVADVGASAQPRTGIRQARTVAADHTVSWQGQRWGVWREDVCGGLRGARVEIERRLDGSHWLRFRGRYLPLHACPAVPPISLTPSGLRPTGVSDHKRTPEHKYIPSPGHPWRKPWKRTFLFGRKPDIPTLR